MSKFATFFAALLLIPSAASAQLAGGRSGTSSTTTYSGRIAFDELNAFGACFATRQTKDALRLVSTEAGSADEARIYKALFSKEQYCLGDLAGLSVPWQLVRGAVGEGFYSRRVPVPANLALPRDLAPDKVKSVFDAASCYAGRHPADARALIETTKPATKEESAMLDAHWAEFEECLPPNMPAGFKFDTLLLRYRIAEALWRMGRVHN
ncbi:MAG: hypothetical protein ACJ8E3_09590 [Sphingomicrobium sp.]